MRHYNLADKFLLHVDRGLRTVLAKSQHDTDSSPADSVHLKFDLSEAENKLSAQLMRVNHAGEVAAQGLYHGHELTAHDERIKQQMRKSAQEEQAHLKWCEKRLKELNDEPSILDPIWYIGSYVIGAATGALGDKWSLGFISETEKQVVQHIDDHLSRLPKNDVKSQVLLAKMREDEEQHDKSAQAAGAHELPKPAKSIMNAVSKIMTKTSFWI